MPIGRGFTSNFHLYDGLARDGRQLLFAPSYDALPYCECGESFLQWVRQQHGEALDEPTITSLDAVILSLTIQYAVLLQSVPNHPFNACVPEVFHEILGLLTTKRDELLRQPNGANAATLYIGQEEQAPAQPQEPTPPPPPVEPTS